MIFNQPAMTTINGLRGEVGWASLTKSNQPAMTTINGLRGEVGWASLTKRKEDRHQLQK